LRRNDNHVMNRTSRPSAAWPTALLLGVTVALLGGARPASAQAGSCLYNCEGSECADFSNRSSFCLEQRGRCEAYCSGTRYYGAIAYSGADGAFGWTVDRDDQARAQRDALRYCAEHGSACKSVVWFYNSCGAVAADGGKVAWGRAPTSRQAERIAIEECGKLGGRNCSVKVSRCSPSWITFRD
jgi:hypothetical protein